MPLNLQAYQQKQGDFRPTVMPLLEINPLTNGVICFKVLFVIKFSQSIFMSTLKSAFVIGVTVLLTVIFLGAAAETTASPSLSILKSIPLAELPGKAADLVAAANPKTQTQTTVDIVKSAIGLNPAAATAIVGSIAATTPKMAAVAAATAAGLLPKLAADIARAAASAAPEQAGKIVEAVCRITPESYRAIALAVAEIAPKAAREILAAVAAALPQLKDAITSALAEFKNTTASVKLILAQVDKSSLTVASTGKPTSVRPNVHPVPGPGFVPPPPAPVILDPGQNSQVPTGGRNYANPDPTGENYTP